MGLGAATVTGLKTYQLCPRKFQYAYLERLPSDPGERTRYYALGDLVRAALADWYAAGDRSWFTLDRALQARWDPALFRDSTDSARAYHRARQMLWEKFSVLSARRPLRWEFSFEAAFGGGPFRGRIARIDEAEDGLEILDYRVDRGFDAEADGWPLEVYAAVAARLFSRPVARVRVLLLGLSLPDVAFAPADPGAVETQIARLRRAIRDDRDLAPRPGAHCRFCSYNQICEAAMADARTTRRPNEMLRLFRAAEALMAWGETRASFRHAVEEACAQLGSGTRVAWRDTQPFSPELDRLHETGADLEGRLDEGNGLLVPAPGGGLLVPFGADGIAFFPESVPRGAAEVLGRHLRSTAGHMASHLAATVDGLTGLSRREVLERRLAASEPGTYALVLCDIDHFKKVNDTRGHDAGDEVLRSFGALLAAQAGAVAHRLGGEEFCLLVPGAEVAYAVEFAESVRSQVEALELHGPAGGLRVTSSFGVATSRAGESGAAVLKRADEALYRAKAGGRNRVEADA